MTIEEFNRLDDAAAISLLAACAEIDGWIEQVLAGRPYHSREDLLTRAARVAHGWSPAQVDGALAHHPRIGERPSAEAIGAANAAHSAGEQAAVNGAATAVKSALASGNVAYERRFGRVFLIRAAGRSADDMLAALTERLANDDTTESAVVARELREIALLRLGRAVAR